MGSIQQITMGLTCLAAAFIFGRYVHNRPAPESPMNGVAAIKPDSNGFLPLGKPTDQAANPVKSILSQELPEANAQVYRNSTNVQTAGLPPAPKLPTAEELTDHYQNDVQNLGQFVDANSIANTTQSQQLSANQATPADQPGLQTRKPVLPNFAELASRFNNSALALPSINQPIHEAERVNQFANRQPIVAPEMEIRRPETYVPREFAPRTFAEPAPIANYDRRNNNHSNIEFTKKEFANAVDRFEAANTGSSAQIPPQQMPPYSNARQFPQTRIETGQTIIRNRQPNQNNTRRHVTQNVQRNTGQRFVPGVDIDSYFAARTAQEMYNYSNEPTDMNVPSDYFKRGSQQTSANEPISDNESPRSQDARDTNQSNAQDPQQFQPTLDIATSQIERWRMSTDHAPPEPDYVDANEVVETQSRTTISRRRSNMQNSRQINRDALAQRPEFVAPPAPAESLMQPSAKFAPPRIANQPGMRRPTMNQPSDRQRPTNVFRSNNGNVRSYNSAIVFKPFQNHHRRHESVSEPANLNSSSEPTSSSPSTSETSLTQIGRPNSLRRNSNALNIDEKIYRTKTGDTLQSIAAQHLGMPDYYLAIYLANRDQLQNPAFVPVGIDLIIPIVD